MTEKSQLAFTGERFLPDCKREIWYEHFHRYQMLIDFVADKVVLDAACGEGYGTNIISKTARQVTGVDISSDAIDHAEKHYTNTNTSFVRSDVLSLNFADDSFDVVISFETIEHLAEHKKLLTEFKRVLKKDGILIISTPDKKEYSDRTNFNNEYHVKELYKQEFADLIAHEFEFSTWFGQKLSFQSMVWQLDKNIIDIETCVLDKTGNHSKNRINYPAMYYIVFASNKPIDTYSLKDLYLFSDLEQSVYEHYNEMIREYISVAKKYMALNKKQKRWMSHPIINKCIKWFDREK